MPVGAPAHYRLGPESSRITVRAFATGMLSFFGHSPRFAVHDIRGELWGDPDTLTGEGGEIIARAASHGDRSIAW